MSEGAIVELITAILGSGVLVALITAVSSYIKHKNEDAPNPSVGEVAAAESSDPAIRYLSEALHRTEGRYVKVQRELAEVKTELAVQRERSRHQDSSIEGLRRIVHSWAQWGKWLQIEWETLRQAENPPDLPHND